MRLRWVARSPRKPIRLKVSADRGQLDATAEKFGEAYSMDPTSGSAYRANNYLETALLSRTYFEMAEILARCFKPKESWRSDARQAPRPDGSSYRRNIAAFHDQGRDESDRRALHDFLA
jgi:hypothetical protein